MHARRRQTFIPWMMCALALAVCGDVVSAQREFSPANRQRGRAAVEYRNSDIHIVAAYYHSQRNHEARWLMIETAVSTSRSTLIARDAVALRTPEGREIPLASQRRVGEDVTHIQTLLQNAGVVAHDVLAYFPQRDRAEDMKLFTLPFGDVVHDQVPTDPDHVAVGPFFFESPTGAWESGTYALIVRHLNGTAELPIELE